MCNRSNPVQITKTAPGGMPRGAARKIHCLSAKTCCENTNSWDGLDAHARVSFAVFGKKLFIVKCCLVSAPEPGGIIPNLFWYETLLRDVSVKRCRCCNNFFETVGTLATSGVPGPGISTIFRSGGCCLLYIQKSKKLPEYFRPQHAVPASSAALPHVAPSRICSQGNVSNGAACGCNDTVIAGCIITTFAKNN
jgi:hypothetical protein